MATILESTAAFTARALEHGLTEAQLDRLKRQGISNLSQLAFSLTTPGASPSDDALKTLLNDDPDQVTIGPHVRRSDTFCGTGETCSCW